MLKMLPSGLREVHFEFTPRTRKSEKRGDKQQQQHVQVARESDGRSSKERPEVGENVHFTDDVWHCHSTRKIGARVANARKILNRDRNGG